jgi:hypothetical protein
VKVTLESTERTVSINGVPARIWQGASESGTPVYAFITRIAVREDAGPAALAEFQAELEEHTPPTAEVESWPARMFID